MDEKEILIAYHNKMSSKKYLKLKSSKWQENTNDSQINPMGQILLNAWLGRAVSSVYILKPIGSLCPVSTSHYAINTFYKRTYW